MFSQYFYHEEMNLFVNISQKLLRKSTNIPSCSHCSRAENSSLEKLRYLSLISNFSWIFRKQIPRDSVLLPSPFPQYRYFLYTPLTSRFRKYTKNLPQFRTLTVVRQRQQLSPYWKQTVRLTSPSFTEGWGPFNHPPTSAPQRFSGTQRFAIRSPAWPLKRYQASGSEKDSLSLCDWSTVSKAAVLSGSESNLWFFALHGSDSETEKKKQTKRCDWVCCALSILVFLTIEILKHLWYYHLIVFQLSMTIANSNSVLFPKFSRKLFWSDLQIKIERKQKYDNCWFEWRKY